MALQYVWAHPDRHEVEELLYITLRMMHVRGWRHLVLVQPPRGRVFVGVELAPEANEENARDWSHFLAEQYRVPMTLDELLADPWRHAEVYVDAGIGALMNSVEQRHLQEERARQDFRRRGW